MTSILITVAIGYLVIVYGSMFFFAVWVLIGCACWVVFYHSTSSSRVLGLP
jgi:hypothetical protein